MQLNAVERANREKTWRESHIQEGIDKAKRGGNIGKINHWLTSSQSKHR